MVNLKVFAWYVWWVWACVCDVTLFCTCQTEADPESELYGGEGLYPGGHWDRNIPSGVRLVARHMFLGKSHYLLVGHLCISVSPIGFDSM